MNFFFHPRQKKNFLLCLFLFPTNFFFPFGGKIWIFFSPPPPPSYAVCWKWMGNKIDSNKHLLSFLLCLFSFWKKQTKSIPTSDEWKTISGKSNFFLKIQFTLMLSLRFVVVVICATSAWVERAVHPHKLGSYLSTLFFLFTHFTFVSFKSSSFIITVYTHTIWFQLLPAGHQVSNRFKSK